MDRVHTARYTLATTMYVVDTVSALGIEYLIVHSGHVACTRFASIVEIIDGRNVGSEMQVEGRHREE